MEVRLFDNEKFKETFRDVIDRNEAQLQLFLLNLCGNPEAAAVRGAVYSVEKPLLLFLNALPYNLQLFEIERNTDAVYFLADYITENKIPISGVQGDGKTCEAFIREYKARTEKSMFLFHDMDLLSLTEPSPVPVTGALHKASQSDAPLLTKYICEFFKTVLMQNLSEDDALKTVENAVNAEELYVYVVSGKIVGCVCEKKRCARGTTLGYVFIDGDHRGLGHGKAMVYLMSKRLLERAEYVSLFVEKTNSAAYKAYSDVGFRRLCENRDYRLL